MEHLFVPYQLSLLLRNKGFNEPCLRLYDKEGIPKNDIRIHHFGGVSNKGLKENGWSIDHCTAPLYQQVVDWFREKHNLDVLIYKTIEGSYYFWITNVGATVETHYDNYKKTGIHYFDTYYAALEAAINHAITLLP